MNYKISILVSAFVLLNLFSCSKDQKSDKMDCPKFEIDESWNLFIPIETRNIECFDVLPSYMLYQHNRRYEVSGYPLNWKDIKPGDTMHINFNDDIIPKLNTSMSHGISKLTKDTPFNIGDRFCLTIIPASGNDERCYYDGSNPNSSFYNCIEVECPNVNMTIEENIIVVNIKFDPVIWKNLRLTCDLVAPEGKKLKTVNLNLANSTFRFGPVKKKGNYHLKFVSINDKTFKYNYKYPFESCFPICKVDKTIVRVNVQ